MVISRGKNEGVQNRTSHAAGVKGRQPQERRFKGVLSKRADGSEETSGMSGQNLTSIENTNDSIRSHLQDIEFNLTSGSLSSKKDLNSACQSKMKRNSISQAEMHIQKMPTVIDDGKPMAVWTDIKEIIFPSCSDSRCDIVLNVIKEILDYPEQETNASPCTPKQQMAFLRNFRIVPCGTLLVNTLTIQDKVQILKSMVRTRHITSESTCSRDCDYAKEHTSHDNLLSPDPHVTSEFQKMKSIANNHFCWCVLPWTWSQDKDIAKAAGDFEPIVYNGRYLIPAMKLGSRPYAPMSLIQPFFRQFYSYLFDLSRDHLVGADSEMTRCLSLLEANCVSSYIARQQGWGARWRHITTRDLMIDWQKLCKHVKNPPPALSTENTDLSNNVAMVTPLQMLYDTENDIANYSLTYDSKISMKSKEIGGKTETHGNKDDKSERTQTLIFKSQEINKTEIKNVNNDRFAQTLPVAMVTTGNTQNVNHAQNDTHHMSILNEYAMQLATENIMRKQGSEETPESINNQQSVYYYYLKHPAGDRILKVKTKTPGTPNTSCQNQHKPQQEVFFINNQPISDQSFQANQNAQNYCTMNENNVVLLNDQQENFTCRETPPQNQPMGGTRGTVICQDSNGKKVILLTNIAKGDNVNHEPAKLKSGNSGVVSVTPEQMTQKVNIVHQKPTQMLYVNPTKSSEGSKMIQPKVSFGREKNIQEEEYSLQDTSKDSVKSTLNDTHVYGAQLQLQTVLEHSIQDEQYSSRSKEHSSKSKQCSSKPPQIKTVQTTEHRIEATEQSEGFEECTGGKEQFSRGKHHLGAPNKQSGRSQNYSTPSMKSDGRTRHQSHKSEEELIDNLTSHKQQHSQRHSSEVQKRDIAHQALHDKFLDVEKNSGRRYQSNESQMKPASIQKKNGKHQEHSEGNKSQLNMPKQRIKYHLQLVSRKVKSAGDNCKKNTVEIQSADVYNPSVCIQKHTMSAGNADVKEKELKSMKEENVMLSADVNSLAKETEFEKQKKTAGTMFESIDGILSQNKHVSHTEIKDDKSQELKKLNKKLTESQLRSIAKRAVVLPSATKNQKSKDIDRNNQPKSSVRILPCKVIDVVGSIIEDSLSSRKRLEKLTESTTVTKNNAVSRDAPYRDILFENDDRYFSTGENKGIMSLVSASPFAPDSLRTWRLLNEYDRKSISYKNRNQNYVAVSQSINRNERYKLKGNCDDDEVDLPIISKSCALLPSHQRKVDLMENLRKSISTPLLAADRAKYRVKCQDLKLTFYRLKKNESEKTKNKKTLGNTITVTRKETNVSKDHIKPNPKISSKTNKNQEMVTVDNKNLNPTHLKSKTDQSDKKDRHKKETKTGASNQLKKTVSISNQVEKCKKVNTKKKTKGQKSKKNIQNGSNFQVENSDSNSSWIIDDIPQKGSHKRESRKKNNTDSVAEDNLQDIFEQEWALQGSVFVLTDEKGQGDKRILRRSLRSVLTLNKPKINESCDDSDPEEKSSRSCRKGRRRKPRQKFKLPDVIVTDESSGDTLYDPQLKSVSHADILIPKSFLGIQSDSSKEMSQTNLADSSKAVAQTNLADSSKEVAQTNQTESSDDHPDPNLSDSGTNQKDPGFILAGSHEANGMEKSVRTSHIIGNPELETAEQDTNIMPTKTSEKKTSIVQVQNDKKEAVKAKEIVLKGKRTTYRDGDILKSSYMDKVIREQERILEIIKQKASSDQTSNGFQRSCKMTTKQGIKGSNTVDQNNNDIKPLSDADHLPLCQNTYRVICDKSKFPSTVKVKDEETDHLKENENWLNQDTLRTEETSGYTHYLCGETDIAGDIGEDILIMKIKEENASDVDNSRCEKVKCLSDIEYHDHVPAFCSIDKNNAYITKQIYEKWSNFSEYESHHASENESNCSLSETESQYIISENQRNYNDFVKDCCVVTENEMIESYAGTGSSDNILSENYAVGDREEICENDEVIYVISEELDNEAQVVFLDGSQINGAGDEVQEPTQTKYRNIFEWVQSELLRKHETLAEFESSTEQADKIFSSSDNCLMLKEDLKLEEDAMVKADTCNEVCSTDYYSHETGEDIVRKTAGLPLIIEKFPVLSGLQDVMVSQSSGSSNNLEENRETSMTNCFDQNSVQNCLELEEDIEGYPQENFVQLPENIEQHTFEEIFFNNERRQCQTEFKLYEGELKSMSSLTIPAISGDSNTSATMSAIGGEKCTSNTTLSVNGGESFTSTGTESAIGADSNTSNVTSSTIGEGTSSNISVATTGTKQNTLFESDSDFTVSSIDSVETLHDWKKDGRDIMATDDINKQVTTDSFGIRHIPGCDESGESNSGVILHEELTIPYVSVNGYKYAVLRDVVVLFTNQCKTKCQISKNVLRRHQGIHRTFCTWEHLYLLDQISGPRRRAVQTGEMLLRFDTVVSKISNIQDAVREKHKNTKLKNSQYCHYSIS